MLKTFMNDPPWLSVNEHLLCNSKDLNDKLLNQAVIPEKLVSKRDVVALETEVNWFHVTHAFANLMINSISPSSLCPKAILLY